MITLALSGSASARKPRVREYRHVIPLSLWKLSACTINPFVNTSLENLRKQAHSSSGSKRMSTTAPYRIIVATSVRVVANGELSGASGAAGVCAAVASTGHAGLAQAPGKASKARRASGRRGRGRRHMA